MLRGGERGGEEGTDYAAYYAFAVVVVVWSFDVGIVFVIAVVVGISFLILVDRIAIADARIAIVVVAR